MKDFLKEGVLEEWGRHLLSYLKERNLVVGTG